jgi:hypothetical protein
MDVKTCSVIWRFYKKWRSPPIPHPRRIIGFSSDHGIFQDINHPELKGDTSMPAAFQSAFEGLLPIL